MLIVCHNLRGCNQSYDTHLYERLKNVVCQRKQRIVQNEEGMCKFQHPKQLNVFQHYTHNCVIRNISNVLKKFLIFR